MTEQTEQRHFMVDPHDIGILVEVLEGLDLDSFEPERSLDVQRILLGAQIAKRNNEKAREASEDAEVASFVAELESLPTALPPPTGFPTEGG